MTFEIGFLFAVLVVMVVLFLTEKLPVDLTAFLGLIVLIFGGYLKPSEAFTGFSSPAVITMMSVFIVGAGLLETGVADMIGGRIHRLVGNSETRLIVVLMLVAGVLSAFMNNIAAVAVLMPAVAAIGPKAGLAPSRLFMPLAYGAILGGTTTLVGTPPNILAAEMLVAGDLEPFSLFDFTPMGVALLLLGTLYMVTIGRKLLPERENRGPQAGRSGDLAQVYQLHERLFSLQIPKGSPLNGRTLAETRLGNTLGFKVVAMQQGRTKQLAPSGDTVLNEGDILFVDGRADDVRRILDLQSIELEAAKIEEMPRPAKGVGGVRLRLLPGSQMIGRSLRQLGFRERFGVVVLAVRRQQRTLGDRLAEETLEAGDVIFGLGARERLEALAARPGLEVEEFGFTALAELSKEAFWIEVTDDSPLAGMSIGESRLGELVGLTVAGLVRRGDTRLALPTAEVIESGDRLIIVGEPARLEALHDLGDVGLETGVPAEEALESGEVGMVEATLSPRSEAIGRTLAELDFRGRYGLLALAIWREGKAIHRDLAQVRLHFGDALLLQGEREKIARLAVDPEFVVLAETEKIPRRTKRAPFAFAGLLLMIGLVASGAQPIHVAAFTAASLILLAGALTMQEAYRAIEWRAIFLVAAVLPVGVAMERTGAAALLADSVANLAGPYGPYAILAALVVLASLLSQGLDGAPAVVLLAPVVIQTAENLAVNPYPLMMGVSLAASAAFMTPFSHKANLLVMGAGGYRSSDYLKVGTPLTLLIYVVLVLMIPIFFPF